METGWRTAAFRGGYSKMLGVPIVSLYLVAVTLLYVTRLCNAENAYIWSETRIETSEITCWTCSDKKDNDACNDWAPDLRCPLNHTVCLTRHRFDPSSGLSVLVNKQCVQPPECTTTHVGCSLTDTGHRECVSCCDYSYCNQEVPFNQSSALKLSSFSSATNSGARISISPRTVFLLSLLPVLSLLYCHSLLRAS